MSQALSVDELQEINQDMYAWQNKNVNRSPQLLNQPVKLFTDDK